MGTTAEKEKAWDEAKIGEPGQPIETKRIKADKWLKKVSRSQITSEKAKKKRLLIGTIGGTTGAWSFPTKHPIVKNPNGSTSNVRLGSFTIGKKTYAIPTMVSGKQLSGADAVGVAKKYGLDKYPSFDSVEKAESWIQKNHGKIFPKKENKLEGLVKSKKGF